MSQRKRKKKMFLYAVFAKLEYDHNEFHGAFGTRKLAKKNLEAVNKIYGCDTCFIKTIMLNEDHY